MKFLNFKYKLYLKYIRYRIYYINNANDILHIINNICFFYKNITSDKLTQILTDCFNLYPLTEKELQKLSLIQQMHNLELGVKNYVSFIIWISCIQSITERSNNLLLK